MVSGCCGRRYFILPCGYCDASLTAYAAVVYLGIQTSEGYYLRFVVAKTRVAPLKKQSIPRLELLSALLLSRLMEAMKSSLTPELVISSYHCFTDSRVALAWIQNADKSWKPFVQNWVSEIRSLLPVGSWKHIPGIENPADLPSRGTTPIELLVNKLWRDGPQMSLVSDEQSDPDIPSECFKELQASENKAHGLLSRDAVHQNLLEIQNFSRLHRLIGTLTCVLRFCSALRRKTSPTHFDGKERNFAELLLIKEAHASLKKHKNFAMWKKQMRFFTDENGILRCQGRIDNVLSLPYSTKHPVLIPNDHCLTALYIKRAHARVLHNSN